MARMRTGLLAGILAAALALAGCAAGGATASDHDPGASGNGADGRGAGGHGGVVQVVASTDVYGDIARRIGGDAVHVHAMIDSPNRDPHEFQADARDQLALSSADLVIVNGGGYDDFMTRMLKAAPGHPTVLTVADLPAARATVHDGEVNEHFWYDMTIMRSLTTRLESDLARLRPAEKAGFARRAAAFEKGLVGLQHTEATLKGRYAGLGVTITEPVPLAMLQAIGLVNRTPAAFSEAIEEDEGVAPSVLKRMLDLVGGAGAGKRPVTGPVPGGVAALVYNEQSAGPQTALVQKAAHQAGLPVVPVTETLPAGTHYLGWMRDNLDHIGAALKCAVADGLVAVPGGAAAKGAREAKGAAA